LLAKGNSLSTNRKFDIDLILARHGNTFDDGQRTVWVGAQIDLPLASKGREQAKAIGESLLRSALIPRRIIAGPLTRTWETAAIVASSINRPVNAIEVDKALCEIDYGIWEGKSSDEIRGMGGGEELSAWENDGRWACEAWRSSRDAHFQALAVFIDDIRRRRASPVLVVSSNGVLRLLLQQLDLGLANTKMNTGHLSLLKLCDEGIDILSLNLSPREFAMLSRAASTY
jgi:broad specificity phosphatase PhoE